MALCQTVLFLHVLEEEIAMDIWERLYLKAKEQYHPKEVSPFIYAHHVVCALESENGEIFRGNVNRFRSCF